MPAHTRASFSSMASLTSTLGDGRPLQPLSDVQLPDIIIKRRQARRATGSSKFLGTFQDPTPTGAAPGPSLEDESPSSAVAAAVQAVVEQRPDIAAAIQQASSKLNATGMFEPAVNKLRAAVLLQLKAYKQLQAQNPVLGQATGRGGTLLAGAGGTIGPGSKGSSKDSVAFRLEAMYVTVMASLEQERQAAAAAAAAAEAAAKRAQRMGHTRHRRNNQRRQSTVAIAAAAASEVIEAGATLGQGLGSRLGSTALESSFNRPGSAVSGAANTLNATGASSTSAATRNSLVLGSSMVSAINRRSIMEGPPPSNSSSPRMRLAGTAQLQGASGTLSLPPVTNATTAAAASGAKGDRPGSKGDTRATAGRKGATLKQDVRTALLGPGAAWLGKAPQCASSRVQIRQTALDVVREHMEDAAFSEWQDEVATHREKQLAAYRAAIQAAQQQLMERQLAEEEEAEAEATALGGKRSGDQAPTDASELTMRQLVHWLADRDVPEPEPLSMLLDVSEAAEPGRTSLSGADASSSAAQAASQRLIAARTVREMMAAAQQHIQMRQQTLQAWQHSVPYSSLAVQHAARAAGPSSGGVADGNAATDAPHPDGAQEAGGELAAATAAAGSPSGGGTATEAASTSSCSTSSDATSNPRASVAGGAARRASALGAGRSSVAGAGVAAAAAAGAAGVATGGARSSIAGAGAANKTSGGGAATAAAGPGAATTAAVPAAAAPRVGFCHRFARATAAADGAWKAGAPRLQVPSAEEVEGVPLPALPPLLDLSCEPAKVLQARLVRVWGILGVGPAAQMDMVLRYTARDKVALFEPVLSDYEAAAAAVLQREALLSQVATLKQSMDSCTAAASSAAGPGRGQGTWLNRRKEGSRPNGSQAHALGMTLQEIQQLFWAFLVASKQVAAMATQLHSTSGDQLLVSGQPYPGEDAIAEPQLTKLLHDAWQLLQ